ncbi:gp53-like domain-containing protein [Photorhabdus asymbiotica]|uniref:gp53-like domain-containing protein n=1 Tax=Photorhabdus asymbiotica TaxID=291112 RepID=UPI003DA70812
MSNKNDFKAFSIKDGANVVDQNLYENSAELQTGFPPVGLTTHVLNKALRQSSTIASVVANFMSTQCEKDVLDNGDLATLNQTFTDSLQCHMKKQYPVNLSPNGYQQLPGGLILQWGRHNFTPLTINKVILPTPFKHGCLKVFMSPVGDWIFPMSAAPNGTLNTFDSWVAARTINAYGNEIRLSASDTYVYGDYFAIGY